MRPAVRVALIGFTRVEWEHIEAGLGAGSDGQPDYQWATALRACNIAVANSDDEQAVAEVVQQGRLACTIMLGATPRPGAAAQLSRPIRLAELQQALDRLVQSCPPMSTGVQRVQEDMIRLLGSQSPAPSRPPPPARPAPPQRAAPLAPAASSASADIISGPTALPRATTSILVVDDNDQALRLMVRHLAPLGCELQHVRSAAQALEQVSRQRFEVVFLATGLDGMDSFHACRTLKRRATGDPSPAPVVVMLLTEDAAVHRLRAEMAGADACLGRPLDVEALRRLIGARQPPPAAEAQTTRAASSWL